MMVLLDLIFYPSAGCLFCRLIRDLSLVLAAVITKGVELFTLFNVHVGGGKLGSHGIEGDFGPAGNVGKISFFIYSCYYNNSSYIKEP